ncbi:potassium-transporting ATPase subunit C [Vagococcus penaei]|uniref:Potassium-transporting ATPase KdpC subunit n=1 Tax=Vagococcus penaei TaxID=633807 RepID=A0A1Q2D8A1_9ENTE|nr:K(+)-transporting ATPase subunit C [Vagococcus penaei]AQP54658.1 potassium-transporting ATPase subunit C [Vagococcus penaei]RSU05310.1 potassium-transporting ATPase subunit C [Vagococcus penaei]
MRQIISSLRTPFLMTLLFILICGVCYPLFVTGISQIFFAKQANGSLIVENNQVIGSKLIGQEFTAPYYLQSRPSAVNYNVYSLEDKSTGKYGGVSSGSTNFGPSRQELLTRVKEDKKVLLRKHPTINANRLPNDLLTASASGLDPDISYESALIQLPEIAVASGISEPNLRQFINQETTDKWLHIFGERRVNVLGVNYLIYQEMIEKDNG